MFCSNASSSSSKKCKHCNEHWCWQKWTSQVAINDASPNTHMKHAYVKDQVIAHAFSHAHW